MATCWSTNEIRTLVSVWREAIVQSEPDTVARNHVVFDRINRILDELGYDGSNAARRQTTSPRSIGK